jgi:carbon monoxide dehydrogenase subunit G
MKIEGCEELYANNEKLWSFLSNPEKVVGCFPGVVSWNVENGIIKAKVKAGIGFIKGTFDSTVQIINNDEIAKKATLRFQGSSNMGNFVADVSIYLKDEGGKKLVCYSSDAKVSGTISTLPSTIIGNTVKKMVKEFLECTQKKV